MVKVRVATWNLAEGKPADGYEQGLQELAELEPDIVLLQEVAKKKGLNHVADVADACGHAWRQILPGRSSIREFFFFLPQQSKKLGDRGVGIGLTSKYPVTAWHSHELTTNRSLLTINPSQIQMDQPRQVIAARIDIDGYQLTVGSTHLSWKPGVNQDQMAQAEEFMASLSSPHVLGGDFNSRTNGTRWESLAEGLTYPAKGPARQIDHIVGDVKPLASFAQPLATSDHCVLVADVEIQ